MASSPRRTTTCRKASSTSAHDRRTRRSPRPRPARRRCRAAASAAPRPPTSGTAGSPPRPPAWSPGSAGAARPRTGPRPARPIRPRPRRALGDLVAQLGPETAAARSRVRARAPARRRRLWSACAARPAVTLVSMTSIAETICLVSSATWSRSSEPGTPVTIRLPRSIRGRVVGALEVVDLGDVERTRRRASPARPGGQLVAGRLARRLVSVRRLRRRSSAELLVRRLVRRSVAASTVSGLGTVAFLPAGRSRGLTRTGHARCSCLLREVAQYSAGRAVAASPAGRGGQFGDRDEAGRG